jgi:hypothetical protein
MGRSGTSEGLSGEAGLGALSRRLSDRAAFKRKGGSTDLRCTKHTFGPGKPLGALRRQSSSCRVRRFGLSAKPSSGRPMRQPSGHGRFSDLDDQTSQMQIDCPKERRA